MPIVQNIETCETCEVSETLIESSEVLKLMLEDTTLEDTSKPIPLTIDINIIKELNLVIEKLETIKIKKTCVEHTLLSFIENHYQEFINSYVNINFPNLRFIKKLNKIVESVSVENVVSSFYATNFLECPTLIRGIAFLLGFMITKTSYDTKFRIFNAMRYRLGHLTSKEQLYHPTEPIEKGWDAFIELMEPQRLAVPIEVIEIINNTASYKVDDTYIKDLEIDIFMAFGQSGRKHFNHSKRVIHGKCNGTKCFQSTWIKPKKSYFDSDSDSDSDSDFTSKYDVDYNSNIKTKLRLEKKSIIENISFLETSNVTCLRGFFKDCDKFDIPLLWNTSNVVDFLETFAGASNFNQPLNWNTPSAKNMSHMFSGATNFNQPLYWNTINVSKMSGMFFRCLEFNSKINFVTNNLEYADSMFAEAPKFNQPVNFNTENLKYCDYMFRGATEFNQPVFWNTPKLLTLTGAFYDAINFNQKVPWNTNLIKDFRCVFRNAINFNQPIEWNFRRATMTNNMFYGAKSYNYPIKSRSPKLVSMNAMFRGAISFNSIVKLDTGNVSEMKEVFREAKSFNQSLDDWCFDKAYVMTDMFLEAVDFSYRLPFDHTRVKYPCALFN